MNNPKTTPRSHNPIRIAALACLMIAILLQTVTAWEYKSPSTSSSRKTNSTSSALNPGRTTYTTSFTGNAGWRVATGKIDLGSSTNKRNLQYGKTVLSGLSGLVAEKGTLTLKAKADLKHKKTVAVGKYQSLVDFVREQDSSTKRGRTR